MTLGADTRSYLLAFADDEHLMGQQHTEWIGVTPFLEEDLAFSSIGQDELGHAAMLYGFILESDGTAPTDPAIDALAYERDASEYRSCGLVESCTDNWAMALVRHWVYDTVEEMRWGLLKQSSLKGLADLVRQAVREESFHRLHANALLDVLLEDGHGQERILAALHQLQPQILDLMAPIPGEAASVSTGVASGRLCDSVPKLEAAISSRFEVQMSLGTCLDRGNHRLTRSSGFSPLMSRMREVLDFDLDATW